MGRVTIKRHKDSAVAVVVGALLLAVILISIFSAYLLFYVPSTAESNAIAAITTEQNDLIGLAQQMNNPAYTGVSVTQSMQLGYAGVPPFSQATQSTVSYFQNSSIFKSYLNYTFSVNLTNSTFTPAIKPGTLAMLPIIISSGSNAEPASGFNMKLVVNSSLYQTYEAQYLTNIFFMYPNGTVIPSWLENNNTNYSSATTYWLKLYMGGLSETVYMVFLSPNVNVMNCYQTGEAPSLSPVYGEYDDGSSVFALYFNGNTPISDFSVSASYSLSHSTVPFGGRSINALNVTAVGGVNSFVPVVYTGKTISAGYNWIEEASLNISNMGSYQGAGILGVGTSPSSSDYGSGVGSSGTSGTFADGLAADGASSSAGPVSLYSAYENNGVPTASTQTTPSAATLGWFYGEMDYNGTGPSTSFSVYGETQLYHHNQTGTGTNSVPQSGNLYLAPIANNLNKKTLSFSYYYNWMRVRAPPVKDIMPTASFSNITTSAVPMLPISLTNSQTNETGPYVQAIYLNSSKYQAYESPSLSNIFFTYSNGTIIPSWLESGNSNLSYNTTYWLSLFSLPPLSNTTIFAVFLPTFMNAMNDFRTGEAPNLTSTYGEYDDGAHVFAYYDNGMTLPPLVNTGTSGSGPSVTSAAPAPWSYAITGSTASTIPGASSWTTAGVNNTSSPSLNLSSSYAVQAQVYMTGHTPEAGILTNVKNIVNGQFYVFGLNGTIGQSDLIGYYPAGGGAVSVLNQGSSVVSPFAWYQLSVVDINDNLSLYVKSGFGLSNLGQVNVNQVHGVGYKGGGIAVTTLNSISTDNWTMILARALPAGNMMPKISIGTLNPGLASPNILLYSKNVQVNGTFSALTSFAHSGVTGLYLSDGAVILKAGTQSIIGGKLPINVTSNATGYGLSLNAVSVQGSNLSASNYGATQITLSNSLSTAINYYGGELVHLVSGTQIPYTAVVGNITLTQLSYTIVGNLSGAFNYSLYEKFGNGQSTTGGKWVLPISSLAASSTQNKFSILLTAKSQNLHSISFNYNSYILGGL